MQCPMIWRYDLYIVSLEITPLTKEISKNLEAYTYETKTLGTRHQHEAKPCGYGVYSIVHHAAGDTRSIVGFLYLTICANRIQVC